MERQFGLNPFALFVAALMLTLVGLSSLVISQFEITVGVLIALGLVVGFIVFLKTELAVYILIFSMLLSPELVVGGLATTRAALGRGVTFRFDDFLLVIIALTWFIRSALNKELGIFKKTPLNSAMLAYILACSVSTLIGMAAGNVQVVTGTLFLLKYTQYFAIFFLVINNIDSEEKLRRYWWAVLITALVVGTLGLSQIPGGGRVTAPFEGDNPEPNTFGGYLAFLILICFAMSLSFKDFKWRIIYGLMAFYLFIPFLFTPLARFLPGIDSGRGRGVVSSAQPTAQLCPVGVGAVSVAVSLHLSAGGPGKGQFYLDSSGKVRSIHPFRPATGYLNLRASAKLWGGLPGFFRPACFRLWSDRMEVYRLAVFPDPRRDWFGWPHGSPFPVLQTVQAGHGPVP